MSWQPIRDNAMGLPLSILDIILLMATLQTAAIINQDRLIQIHGLLLLALPSGIIFASYPAAPDAGTSPRAFLIGLLLSFALGHALTAKNYLKIAILISASIGALIANSYYDSTAVAIFPFIGFLTWLVIQNAKGKCRTLSHSIAIATLLLVMAAGSWLTLNSSNLSELASKLSRLKLWKCYIGSALRNSDILLRGVGLENTNNFCQIHTDSGFHYHAHNLPIHILGTTGMLGLTGLAIFCWALAKMWAKEWPNYSPKWRALSTVILTNTILQSLVDLSAFHYPITIILLGIAITPSSTIHSDANT